MAQAIPSERRLTITELVEASRSTLTRGRCRGRCVPMIRMRGDWLEENGFVTGEHVVIRVERGRIVVTLAGEE
jgi:hypothetical protein